MRLIAGQHPEALVVPPDVSDGVEGRVEQDVPATDITALAFVPVPVMVDQPINTAQIAFELLPRILSPLPDHAAVIVRDTAGMRLSYPSHQTHRHFPVG